MVPGVGSGSALGCLSTGGGIQTASPTEGEWTRMESKDVSRSAQQTCVAPLTAASAHQETDGS